MARKALYPQKHKQPVSTIFRIVQRSFFLGTVTGTTHLPLARVHYEQTKDKYICLSSTYSDKFFYTMAYGIFKKLTFLQELYM